jgi:methylated-DNA-[protein]-cysteine S-methyltransferase
MPAPESLCIDRIPSPIGALFVVCDERDRLRALVFEDQEARVSRLLPAQHRARPCALVAGRAPGRVAHALEAFFSGSLDALDTVEVKTAGTEFQHRVWDALREIPSGATISYGHLARTIGRPRACRAVGLANGANPVGIVVPCHRVIGADGTLTGYGGGLERKRWLLAHERRWHGVAAASEPATASPARSR